VDTFDATIRSRIMSRIRSYGTKTTEWRFRSFLMRSGVRGWRVGHSSDIAGKPDFIFMKLKLAVFIDGCFWHGCRRCTSNPKTHRNFWLKKITGNRARDVKFQNS